MPVTVRWATMEDLNPIFEELKRLSADLHNVSDVLVHHLRKEELREAKTESPPSPRNDMMAEYWRREAERNQVNIDYYRGLVVKIGEMFGPEAKTQDDGGISEDVLCAKVPELVAKAVADARRYHFVRGSMIRRDGHEPAQLGIGWDRSGKMALIDFGRHNGKLDIKLGAGNNTDEAVDAAIRTAGERPEDL